jgi:PhnB protein
MPAKKQPRRKAAKSRKSAKSKPRRKVAKPVKPIPDNYPTVAPYLSVAGAANAIEFYKKAFGAKERFRLAAPEGRIMHAELTIGNGLVMMADEFPDMGFLSPQAIGGSPVTIHVYVKDVDALAERAIAAGAISLRPVADQFYGDRSGTFKDPFGHIWNFATHKENVSKKEMQKRFDAMSKS